MFGLFKKSRAGDPNEPAMYLFEVPFRIRPLKGCSLPKELKGAVVACYVPGTDHLRAIDMAFHTLTELRFEVVAIAGEVKQLEPRNWCKYIAKAWPEFQSQLPTQVGLEMKLKTEAVFLGPFCAWDGE